MFEKDRLERRPSINPKVLIGIKNMPRTHLLCLVGESAETPPIAMQYFDVTRATGTNGDEHDDNSRTIIR